MSEEFQLEPLLGLGLPPPGPPVPVVREIRVDDRILGALINQAEALIRADAAFRAKLSEKLATEDEQALKPFIDSACKKAASELRAAVSNVVVQGFWPLAEAVLRAIVVGELAVIAGKEALALEASPDQTLQAIGQALKEAGLKTAQEFFRFQATVSQLGPIARPAQEAFAQEFFRTKSFSAALLRGMSCAKALAFAQGAEEARRKILQLCLSLVTQGRIHRFELMELDALLRDLASPVLPRDRVLAGIERLATRLATGKIRELSAPLGGETDARSPA